MIGVGSMGANHARVYAELPEIKLNGVCDSNPITASRVGDLLGTAVFTDYHQLLKKIQPQVVSIAVPTALHEEVALAAFEAGADVLLEKPIAGTIESGQRIIHSATRHGRKLMIGHIVRFNPAIQALKEKLERGEIGRVLQISARRVGPFPARIRDVGVVIDLATHDLDLLRFLVDSDPLRIYAETEQGICTTHEDLLLGLLNFPNQVKAFLEINWLSPTKIRQISVLGEQGMLFCDDITQTLTLKKTAHIQDGSSPAEIAYPLQYREPLKAELLAFLHTVIADRPPPVSGEDGLAALRMALSLVQSGRTHRVVELA